MMNDESMKQGDLWVKQALTQNPSPTQYAMYYIWCMYNTPVCMYGI